LSVSCHSPSEPHNSTPYIIPDLPNISCMFYKAFTFISGVTAKNYSVAIMIRLPLLFFWSFISSILHCFPLLLKIECTCCDALNTVTSSNLTWHTCLHYVGVLVWGWNCLLLN
jgi:hypothetical protein